MLFGCFIPFQIVLIPMARTLGMLGHRLEHAGPDPGARRLRPLLHHAVLPQLLRGVPDRAGQGGADRRRRLLHASSGGSCCRNSLPILVVTVIWQFTNIWNDFLFGASFAAGGAAPITVALNNIVNTSTGVKEYNVDMAGGHDRGPADAARLRRRRPILRARPDGRRGQGMTPWPSLTISNVKKHFGAAEILKGIDIAIEDGEFLVLVGPSGCGKSTLLNMIAGLETITDGEIRDRRPAGQRPAPRRTATSPWCSSPTRSTRT